MFRVTGPLGFAYADMLGSGIETAAHLQENGRICVMFASFEGPPKILRLHGTGRVVQQADPEFGDLLAGFDIDHDQRVTVRSIIAVDVVRVADACGYQVPRMDFVAERDQLVRYADNRLRKEGEDAVKAYVTENNAESIDGLRGLDPLVEVDPGRPDYLSERRRSAPPPAGGAGARRAHRPAAGRASRGRTGGRAARCPRHPRRAPGPRMTTPAASSAARGAGREPEAAEVEAGERLVLDSRRGESPGRTSPRAPRGQSEHASGAISGIGRAGSSSACAASSPARRASASTAY